MYIVEFSDKSNIVNEDGKLVKGCLLMESARKYVFETNQDAWRYFKASICESYNKRDFFGEINWDDLSVWVTHFDEGGSNCLKIWKWEGFDNDIELYFAPDGDNEKLIIKDEKFLKKNNPINAFEDGKELPWAERFDRSAKCINENSVWFEKGKIYRYRYIDDGSYLVSLGEDRVEIYYADKYKFLEDFDYPRIFEVIAGQKNS